MTLRPTSLDELHTALADTARTHPRLLIAANGTAADWGGRPEPADASVDVTGLSGVLVYNPADMTMAVRAGTPLAVVQEELSKSGQRVAFDAARVARGATLGGLFATADGGPSRQCFGILRDLVIGVTVVLADGTVARSGGHVIKNVAGYDLAKLFHGSFGTLGVVAEVVLRLHPQPRAEATVEVAGTAEEAFASAGRIIGSALDAAALEWVHDDDAGGRMLVRLEGTPDGVTERVATATALSDGRARTLEADAADAAWRAAAAVADGTDGDTVLRVGSLPSEGPRLVGLIAAVAAESKVDVALSSTIAAGVHTVRLRGGDRGAHDQVLAALGPVVGAACTVHRRDGLGPDTSSWVAPPPTAPLMRAIKQQFDPQGRFGNGRFAPWLTTPGPREKKTS
ncbi:glycolate oxidase FAD binding subunit [Nocardia sp. GAS34]|uniref:FAD-binding oxidoreductase n=1 Tax=unclassified Nocardia TaxID=2637762 RepID=UPI003D1B4DFE